MIADRAPSGLTRGRFATDHPPNKKMAAAQMCCRCFFRPRVF